MGNKLQSRINKYAKFIQSEEFKQMTDVGKDWVINTLNELKSRRNVQTDSMDGNGNDSNTTLLCDNKLNEQYYSEYDRLMLPILTCDIKK